jgi:nucleoside-diphosphate-sugar epimerase
MQKLLLTGVTGFVGSDVLARIIKSQQCPKLVVLARRKPDLENSILARRFREHGLDPQRIEEIEWVLVPFEDENLFRATLAALPKQDNWRVLHMAAIIKSQTDNDAQERLNLGVTKDMLEFANARQAPFYYLSSVVAFGATREKKIRTEKDFDQWEDFNDNYSYFATKRAAHKWILEQAQVSGCLFCPSIVHGSLEGEKSSRGHLRALKQGTLRFAPSGGANFVTLENVAGPIVEAVFAPAHGHKPRTQLLVGPNLRFQDYFNLYLDAYRSFMEDRALGTEGLIRGQLAAMPSWMGRMARATHRLSAKLGWNNTILSSLAQSSSYLYFDTEAREGALPDIADLKKALKESFV